MRKTIVSLFVLLLLLIIFACLLVFYRPQLDKARRQTVQQQLIEQIMSGRSQIVIENVPIIENDEYEMELSIADDTEPQAVRRPTIEVTGYGVIEIPVIELAMPLVKGCSYQSLQAAAGWFEKSAEIGKAGNAVILGHRLRSYGEQFNRLDELKENDEIFITLADGSGYIYRVTGYEVILPDDLMETLVSHNEGFSLTLVTCTPTGVASHRLLVYAVLVDKQEAIER